MPYPTTNCIQNFLLQSFSRMASLCEDLWNQGFSHEKQTSVLLEKCGKIFKNTFKNCMNEKNTLTAYLHKEITLY